MGKVLVLTLSMLTALLLVISAPCALAEASSPAVLIDPDTIPPDGYVDIYITAIKANTILASFDPIKVTVYESWDDVYEKEVLEDYYLEISPGAACSWGPIILPDVGDQVRIRFPDAEVEAMVDDDKDVNIGTGPYGWWTAAWDPRWPDRYAPPDLLSLGIYLVSISGSEGTAGRLYWTVSSFFVIPEFPVAILAPTAPFAALLFKKHKLTRWRHKLP